MPLAAPAGAEAADRVAGGTCPDRPQEMMKEHAANAEQAARRARARRTALIAGVIAFVIYAAAIIQVAMRR